MTANLSQRRSHARHGASEINRTVTAAVEEIEQDKAARYAAAKAAHQQADQDRRRYTRDDLTDVRAVRDQHGWHRVVRVNPTSVTVQTPYSWTERIPFGKILEARA